jgi:beta-glucosidase
MQTGKDENGDVELDFFQAGLVSLKNQYNNPEIIITENGAGYDEVDEKLDNGKVNDVVWRAYLQKHSKAVSRVIAKGVNIKDYFVWSMFDNLE